MERTELQVFFDYAITLEPGEEIKVPFRDKKAANAARMSFYRMKGVMKRHTGMDAALTVSMKFDKEFNKYTVVLAKEVKVDKFYRYDSDGNLQGEMSLTDLIAAKEKERMEKNPLEEIDTDQETDEKADFNDLMAYAEECKLEEDEIEKLVARDFPELKDGKWKELL